MSQKGRKNMEQHLRILVVLPLYGGSLPIGRYCASALGELGHMVDVFERQPPMKPMLRCAVCVWPKTGWNSWKTPS